ncbi:cell division protein ZapE [Limimaricola soesokkakensis]|uniref:cell division protein ZapE n=1 Tax=Limimaricola soesokkakensis TaxID=1343159 RepID=UPI003513F6E2
MTKELHHLYDERVASGALRADPLQRQVLAHFEELRREIAARGPGRGLLNWRRQERPRGLYVWGDVGRGKSMLMDLFVEGLDPAQSKRVHFHAFLRDVHREVHAARQDGAEEPVTRAVARLTAGLRVFAFDEMQVSGIADAMILARLFRAMIDAGITIVTTSNLPPEKLYEDGLQRAAFQSFVDLVSDNFDVVTLDGKADYRQATDEKPERYFSPLTRETGEALNAVWQKLARTGEQRLELDVHGRKLRVASNGRGAARATFAELCEAPLGVADHLALAETVDLLLLDGVPRFGHGNADIRRRFVTLIDALYDARVEVIVRADAEPTALCAEADTARDFTRTASRLEEMRSTRWPQASVR